MRQILTGLFLGLACPACAWPTAAAPQDFDRQRLRMVEDQLAGRDIQDPRVLAAMRKVPRHTFMPEEVRHLAYADQAAPIGHRQTISQPYIVALMTQMAEPQPHHRALEVGTGSGYQAAVLAEVVKEVYTIEILPALAAGAAQTLSSLGYGNVVVREGDGYRGWPEKAPFDIILVTAAAPRLPQPLLDQLGDGGTLVMPVGEAGAVQTLTRIRKEGGQVSGQQIIPVRFVPMTGRIQRPD